MGQDPSVIRAEIEQTRERVGDEVDALSYKTDVGARVGDYVDQKKEAVKSVFTGAKDTLGGAREGVTAATPDPRALERGVTQVRGTAESNPLGLALGGVALGFVLGTLLPRTRFENEQLGEASDRLVDAAKQTAGEAVEHGKEVAREAVGAAVDTARESGREHGQEIASTLQERAQEQMPRQ